MAQPTRSASTRAAQARRLPAQDFRGRLHIDPAIIPKGQHYKWVRESCLGARDDDNVMENQMLGYSPVPADRHPTLVPIPLDGGPAPSYIRRGGMVLMECPQAVYEEYEAQMRRENAEILNGVDTERARSADPNFPALEPELTSQTERKGPGRFEEN